MEYLMIIEQKHTFLWIVILGSHMLSVESAEAKFENQHLVDMSDVYVFFSVFAFYCFCSQADCEFHLNVLPAVC